MKILSTYFDSFTVARHAVVVCPSTMPRQMGYNTHDASQALANKSNNKYTNVWVQIILDRVTTIRGLPHFWGLLSLLFRLVLFLLLKTHVPVGIMEELSPNVRMIPKSVPLNLAKDELRSAKSETCKNQLALIIFCYNSKSMAYFN